MSFSKEERASLSSEHESDDSQNINGSLKENQVVLENELEYNKNEIIDIFNEVNQIQKKVKKVSFNDKNLVTIIDVESYKKYNCPIEIGGAKIKNKKQDKIKTNKKRKDVEDKKEMEFADKYFDKYEDSGKSCFIF